MSRTAQGKIARVLLGLALASPVSAVAWQSSASVADAAKQAEPSAADRQKAMQADMERLLKLARQLKTEVDGSRKDELSLKVVRDADEIDRLARSARSRIH